MNTVRRRVLACLLSGALAALAGGTPAFAADTVKPTVSTRTPSGTGTDISGVSTVVAGMSEAVTGGTISVVGSAPGLKKWTIAGTTATSQDGRTITWTPTASSAFRDGPTYTVTLSGEKDLAGNAAAKVTWTFASAWTAAAPTIITDGLYPSGGLQQSVANLQGIDFFIDQEIVELATGPKVSVTGAAEGLTTVKLATTVFDCHTHSDWYVGGPDMGRYLMVSHCGAMFAPGTVLHDGMKYTVTVSGVHNWHGQALAATSWTFWGPLDTEKPGVEAFTPQGDQQTKVIPVDTAIPSLTAKMSQEIANPKNISFVVTSTGQAAATSTAPETRIPGKTTYDPATRIVTWTPAKPLPYGRVLTGMVTGARNWTGLPMDPAGWSFSRGAVDFAFPIPSDSPQGALDATGGFLDPFAVTVTFDEALSIIPKLPTVTVVGTATGLKTTKIAGVTSYDATTKTLTFMPSAKVPFGPLYTVTVAGAHDLALNVSPTTTFSFWGKHDTTDFEATSSPADKAADVLPGTPIVVTFSHALGDLGKTAKFSVLSGAQEGATPATVVPGKVIYDAAKKSLTFTPTVKDLPGLAYLVKISGLIDIEGNVEPDVTFGFDGLPPDVTKPAVESSTPADNGALAIGKGAIKVTMSEAVIGLKFVVTSKVGSANAVTIAGKTTYDVKTRIATFTPSVAWTTKAAVTVTVSSAKDPSGNAMVSTDLTFTVN